MAKNRLRVLGGKEIEKALRRKLEEAQAGLEDVGHAAAEPIREAASDKAPERTGALSEHIVRETLEKETDRVVVGVGPDETVAWYGHFVEFGTNAHRVTRDQARGLAVDDDGFAASMAHPGAQAQPYLRPALDEQADAAVDAAGEELKKKLDL